ncbi:hypothetical protein ACJRO7_015136 [Eucalyptus globulus]
MAWDRAKSRYLKPNTSKNNLDFVSIGVSEMGLKLLDKILSIKFQGLTGELKLSSDALHPIAFEIFNVVGQKEETIGYWTLARGLSPKLNLSTKVVYIASTNDLKRPTWPGDTLKPPKGWVMPIIGKKLRIGVPKKDSFDVLQNRMGSAYGSAQLLRIHPRHVYGSARCIAFCYSLQVHSLHE